MLIKEIFDYSEDGKLTYEQYEALVKEKGAKFTDLSEGKYVSKSKYESDLKAKDAELESVNSQITNLNSTIATRDADLSNLQKQLEEAGQDATKLAELSTQFAGLQAKYDEDVQKYQEQMRQQAYKFAVTEFANTKKFTSQAARRDFERAMINRQLQMEDDKILGREDFFAKFAEENADAFVVETPEPKPAPAEPTTLVPEFVAPTQGPTPQVSDEFDFGFIGVRSH